MQLRRRRMSRRISLRGNRVNNGLCEKFRPFKASDVDCTDVQSAAQSATLPFPFASLYENLKKDFSDSCLQMPYNGLKYCVFMLFHPARGGSTIINQGVNIH